MLWDSAILCCAFSLSPGKHRQDPKWQALKSPLQDFVERWRRRFCTSDRFESFFSSMVLIEKGWKTFVALGDVKIQGHVLGTQFVQQQVDELCFAQLSHSRLLHLRLIHSQGCLNLSVDHGFTLYNQHFVVAGLKNRCLIQSGCLLLFVISCAFPQRACFVKELGTRTFFAWQIYAYRILKFFQTLVLSNF